jgi:hypothetical protein
MGSCPWEQILIANRRKLESYFLQLSPVGTVRIPHRSLSNMASSFNHLSIVPPAISTTALRARVKRLKWSFHFFGMEPICTRSFLKLFIVQIAPLSPGHRSRARTLHAHLFQNFLRKPIA